MYSSDEFMELMIKAHHGNYIKKGKRGTDIWNSFRGFEFILYPEHFEDKDDIISKCKDMKIPSCLSPEHNQDKKEDGTLKKAHYHYITYYSGKTTPFRAYSDFCNIFGSDSFATMEVVGSMPGAVAYQAHIDNCDDSKVTYDKNDILGFNGFNVNKYLANYIEDDIMMIKKELKKFINDYNVIFFDEMDDLLEENDLVLAETVSRSREIQRWLKDYLKSREHRLWYKGDVEKGYTKIHMDNGTDKVIFNRELKVSNI